MQTVRLQTYTNSHNIARLVGPNKTKQQSRVLRKFRSSHKHASHRLVISPLIVHGAITDSHRAPFFKGTRKYFCQVFKILKGAVKFSLPTPLRHIRLSDVQLQLFLTSALDASDLTPQSLYSRKEHRYPLNRRLGGSQSWSVHFGEKKNLLPVLGSRIASWFI